MMRIVLHQPYFLPWLGFFAKLQYADAYVALDDARFRKRHYHDRARIISMHGEPSWLSLPVGQHLGQRLIDVQMGADRSTKALVETVAHSYSRARSFDVEAPAILAQLGGPFENLATYNLRLISEIAGRILPSGGCPIIRSTDIGYEGDATSKIIHLCKAMGADGLIVGPGASLDPSVHDLARLKQAGLRVWLQNFLAAGISYPQSRRSRAGFVSGLSGLDALLNVGGGQLNAMLRGVMLEPVEIAF